MNAHDGLASELVLPEGKVLYHGTLAETFNHRHEPYPIHFTHPPMPDSPAWFADNRNFSLHAAMRYTIPGREGRIHLHKYTIRSQLKMMSLPDIENFRVFMREMLGVKNLEVNGLMEGVVLARWSNEPMGLDGYALERDMVRGEPEYVLFQAGLKRLTASPPQVIRVEPIDGMRSRLIDNDTNAQLATYTYDNGPGTLV